MDAGVPIKRPVAGVGLRSYHRLPTIGQVATLTDIQGR